MPTVRNGRCVKTIFDREILCSGTLSDRLNILQRELDGTDDIDDLEATEDFTAYGYSWGYFEAIKYTAFFDGVNVDNEATHIFYMPFDQAVYEMGANTLWLEKPGARNRLFKMLKIQDYGEEGRWLAIEAKETGFKDQVASEG